MFKKIIVFIFIVISFNINADNDFIKENFNKKNMSLSESYRNLVLKHDIISFIKKNTVEKTKKYNIQKYLIHDYSELCYDLYSGKDFLIKNKRESKICLKYAILNGYYNSAKYLSIIEYNEKNILDSISWAGIAAGQGVNVKDLEVYKKYINKSKRFNDLFLESAKKSSYLTMKDLKKEYEGTLDIFDFTIEDYSKYIKIYNFLKYGEFEELTDYLSENVSNANSLILLSHSKNKDWTSLMKYCDLYFDDRLNQYCLKSINKYGNSDLSLMKYSLNEIKAYKENKLQENRFKNSLRALGNAYEKGNNYSNLTFNLILEDIDKSDYVQAIVYFNEGRKYYNTQRNLIK